MAEYSQVMVDNRKSPLYLEFMPTTQPRPGRRGRSNITVRLDDAVIDLIDDKAADDETDRSGLVRSSLSDTLGVEVS